MLAVTSEDGITFNYTLVNQQTGLWYQTARNARTGALYAEYSKTSPTMTMFNQILKPPQSHKRTLEVTGQNLSNEITGYARRQTM